MKGYRAAVTRRACVKLTRIFWQGMDSLAERIHRCGDGQGCENGAEEGHLFAEKLVPLPDWHRVPNENGWKR